MDWKTRVLLMAVAGGALAGFLAGMLYIRQVEDSGGDPPKKLETGDAFSIAMSALGVVRQVASLGRPAS